MEVKADDVQFFPGEPFNGLVRDSVLRFDRLSHRGVCQWNTKLAVYIVRRGIQHWTSTGFPAPAPGDGKLHTSFKKTKLCKDILAFYGDVLEDMSGSDAAGATAAVNTELDAFQVLWD